MNIRVDLNTPIKDGTEVVFRSPVDCSQVTGLIVYYPGYDGETTSKEFAFADAHGNNVGDIDHLFAENVVVKVILDLSTNMAFVQNADTNAYLEGRFAEAVTHIPQSLTDAQKAQARANIGAIGEKTDNDGEIFNDYENNTAGDQAHAEGGNAHATGANSHAEGLNTIASGERAHAEGKGTTASGQEAHAEGNGTKAVGFSSHAEGLANTTTGGASHAEGNANHAEANCSHAEGHGNSATGYATHVEGRVTEARGHSSHAEGRGTFASGAQQHVAGTYNEIDYEGADGTPLELADDGRPAHQYGGNEYKERKSKYARIVGNGTSDTDRSNAETLDWDGNLWDAGIHKAKDFVLDGDTDPLGSMLGMKAAVVAMQSTLGNDIMVIKPAEAGTLVLQENTYYQFVGSSTKKKLNFYNSDNTIATTLEFQVLTIHCGSMTDNAKYGIVEDMSPAYLFVIGNDTGLTALTGAETGTYAFKKYLPDSTEINTVYRAEVEYPAGSTIIIQTKNANPLPSITT